MVGAGAIVVAGYNTMAPRSQLYGRTFIGEGPESRRLALTFDDGPNDPHTLQLLDVLDREGVRATFFMLGRFVAERPDIARRVYEAGHAVGNHTYSHPNLIFCRGRHIRREISDCAKAIEDAIGDTTRLFRPPHGGRTPVTLLEIRRAGYEPVMWTVSGWDWNPKSPGQIAGTVEKQIRGGDLILLHDGGHERLGVDRSATVHAVEMLIRRCRQQGYEFVSVPEMIDGTGPRPHRRDLPNSNV